jgi:anti-sigma B factor antagonist
MPFRDGAPCVVRLSGDLDLAAADAARDMIMRAVDTTTSDRVEVDLTAVPFLDSTGIRALIQARKYAVERGVSLVLARPTEPVHRVLMTLGLHEFLDVRFGQSAPASP